MRGRFHLGVEVAAPNTHKALEVKLLQQTGNAKEGCSGHIAKSA
jgi:hypothetical protein